MPRPIAYSRNGFVLDGKPTFLLIGTVNYFRTDPGDWEHRLRLFKESGFNTVDVYVAWCFHQPTEAPIDFESPGRDLNRYLTLCRELGLFVYFRPGPYICNEIDGGGLPAWLPGNPGVRIRQNNAEYLTYVRQYLTRVNQIALPHLYTHGGPIILYAIENELDFYPCDDVAGYMTALRSMVKEDGVDVPIAACIGQRTPIDKAMGRIAKVLPTPNVYVGGAKVEVEAAAARDAVHNTTTLDGQKLDDVPAFITETGRDHATLARLLSVGFKGLGPFNFAGGSNWDRFHGVNNWGAYKHLTTTIDFGGMIRFDGRIDQTWRDARRLARFIRCLEPEILNAEPITSESGGPRANLNDITYSLAHGPTRFVFLPNFGDAETPCTIDYAGRSLPTLQVKPKSTAMLTIDLPLDRFGIDGAIEYATCELQRVKRVNDGVELTFAGPGEVAIRVGDRRVVLNSATSRRTPSPGTPGEGRGEGRSASHRTGPHPNPLPEYREREPELPSNVVVHFIDPNDVADLPAALDLKVDPPIDLLTKGWIERSIAVGSSTNHTGPFTSLESLGVLHGAGVYEVDVDATEPIRSIAVDYAADHVGLWVDGQFLGTKMADGNRCSFDVQLAPGKHTVWLRAAIWGRGCFHDAKWPAMHLGSPRGLVGPLLVNGKPHASTWRFTPELIQPLPIDGAGTDVTLKSVRLVDGARRSYTIQLTEAHEHGAVIDIDGTDIEGTIDLNGAGVGRFGFGAIYSPTGGHAHRMLLPGRLCTRGAMLTLNLRGNQPGGGVLTKCDLIPLITTT
ncbi:MAG: beta-galactosidase [Tepidisphaeraceae bacterium]